MAFNNWEKFVEEYNKQNPGALPEDAAARMTEITPPENTNYDVNISNTTVPMQGRSDSLPGLSPSPAQSSTPKWELEDDPVETPTIPVENASPTEPSSAPTKNDSQTDKQLETVLSTDNDSARRDTELAQLEKRKLPNKLASFGAGIGDAISAAAAPFGGNAPGGFQRRLMERQDKQMADDKANIEVKLRNDPNSDISKQYQALVGQFLQKDPSDPAILGLTANQIAEKIPQIEKLASLRQQDELKRLQMDANKEARLTRQDAAQDKLDLKSKDAYEKKQASIQDAKQQAGVIRGTIKDIINRDLVGFDTTGPGGSKWFAPLDYPDLKNKLDTVAGNIAFTTLNKMRQNSPTGGAVGQVSDRDMALLASVKGALTQEQSPKQLLETLKRLDELYTKVEGYDADIEAPWKDATPPAENAGPRKTKSGLTYTTGK